MRQLCTPLLLGLALNFNIQSAPAQNRPDSAHAQRREVESLPYAPPNLKIIAPPSLPPVPPEVVAHGDRGEKKIALTFDACSTRLPSHYDERVTQVLVDTKTPATIFLGGKWMEDEPEHTKYLASLPQFELGNHTFLHPHMPQVSEERMREELRWTQEVMYTLTGRQAKFFRPPYGEYNDRVVKIAAAMGLTTVEFDLASGDPDAHITKEKLIEYVTNSAKNGSIIVMHINQRGWHTAEALPEIIAKLRARGFKLVTVGELISAAHREERQY
ncbi:MAG: polysaccharide deacetylase family protein [candidate division KSB1 bacterium]|nr:polysaccharide deacetylase family protein [candidate division KSB1 bacterium]MDZ7364552.1 polysaccharide deacetylase family protein [candidate division KSB1 bacterium]MDZ7405745.1 polysaccharide deacetylase family protein [candidate division KSB1 bacterium]